ncbi:pilus assembly protein [Pseudothauera rhizosphaerae]|uniref:Pilus assembly protein n=2 Tax=Pseudothauera rhizosphaerae TaxID=2565932 RepID=A0A4S4B0Q6_9RHOO|nr:pilus assembly protein [Pseudothauera rhizosphaerae]
MPRGPASCRICPPPRQRGAAAIEFALLFLLFFVLFYALVSYAIAMLMVTGFEHAALGGARAAIAVDPGAFSGGTYIAEGVAPRVRESVARSLDWLPPAAKARVLGEGNTNVGVAYGAGVLTVRVRYPDYAAQPLLPVLVVPLIGPVPRLPEDLEGQAVVELVPSP